MKPRKRIENGDQLRACELPTARAIKYSCGGKDAVVTKIADDPYDERGDEYDFPDYTVSDVSCAFSNTERSAADCQFTISGDGFAERAETAQLRYIFMDLSDGIAHDYFVTQWTTDESCIAEKRSTTPNG